ncbi:MAG: Butyrate kinase 2 [Firmicutes bacterium ADurb.Bin506]|nr:MAG: Butyrate kinase 2 [Firmicutes bacterium ADurb.Bin506]
MFKQLVINPGSTSTKVALFEDSEAVASKSLAMSSEALAKYPNIFDQLEMRLEQVRAFLSEAQTEPESLHAVVGRGGVLPPSEGGVYEVDDEMIERLRVTGGGHASSLGGVLAREVAGPVGIPAFIADPVTTDELDEVSRYTGLPEAPRVCIFHALNQKAVARRAASDLGEAYENINLIVVHLGGGISVGAHRRGRVVEVANALSGEGTFSPERSGGLPVTGLVKLCFSGQYSQAQIAKLINGKGGLVAYLGTNSLKDVDAAIAEGDDKARLCLEAMAYQVAKDVGRSACALAGDVEAIVLTGGGAHSARLVGLITDRVRFIAPVLVYPGEEEMKALAEAGLRVLSGAEKAKRMFTRPDSGKPA